MVDEREAAIVKIIGGMILDGIGADIITETSLQS
jgi:hypothetical protein